MNFSTLDIVIFIGYCVLIIAVGILVSREKKGHDKNSTDYFLASKSLPWWAIGASLIASNISAEQFIGMSGSGFAVGLAIASYEFMAAATLIIVAKYFLPIYIKENIYTMPQFLKLRYDDRIRTSLAIFWIMLYIFVNLTSVLYLSALALSVVLGFSTTEAIIALAFVSVAYSIYGGLKAVAWTDVIQVVFLILGGLITTYLALDAVSGGLGAWEGLGRLYREAPDKFDMILTEENPFYKDLPGITVLVGGMWIANISYWGFNQYIVQRALAAKSVKEVQWGLAFAAFLKLLIPLVVVIPGIAAFVLNAEISRYDEAYPWLLGNLVPTGIKGLAFAALIAAALSSLSSMMNSTATIFTLDIYKSHLKPAANEKELVTVGRLVSLVSIIIAAVVAQPLLAGQEQVFQFIQKYTGYVSPGIVVLFIFGLFWKKTTSNAALAAAIASVPVSILIDLSFPLMPFLDQMGLVFLLLSALVIIYSLYENKAKKRVPENYVRLEKGMFASNGIFNVASTVIVMIIAAIYIIFW
ncbi:SSS family solute:Na+ symporter [Pontibacter ummariensis]|uniref:Solute:Na+ symporter, SSS family n=1 Tax=Pontibacter ummariensis TaxID=1610492 RepID=A0A239IAZ1_9BACT|nr:sodium/sugar symporter [Pontibacter ummariensis]PRY10002.1 SSS family solute:Na+ symporter [Pontibacter ummariensis]SNS89554.1 solute:Na+ symporter, SSS family [Pontibacter ummariensis]